jgi:hypothetical protein
MPDAKKVNDIFLDCLFRDDEIVDGEPVVHAVVVEGVAHKYGFHCNRLQSNRQAVVEQIKTLPDTFKVNGGGGWSFLNLCIDNKGQQWAEQITAEKLLCLALGLRLASYCLQRDLWSALPGQVPYVVFKNS